MKKRILASLLALYFMGAMLLPAVLAAEPDTTMSTIGQKLEQSDEVPANHALSSPANAGEGEDSLEPVLADAGEGEAPTSGACGENATWEFDPTSGILTIRGSGEITSKPWISSSTNYSQLINHVIVEEGISKIGNYIFLNTPNLSSANLPTSLKSMGEGAFMDCTKLTTISLPTGIETIEPWTFSGCKSLEQINLPSSVSSIEKHAFSSSGLVEISLPNNVSLNEYAFGNCDNLVSVIIPENVTSIAPRVFINCPKLTSAGSIGGEYAIQFGWNSIIPETAFMDCDALQSIYIPNRITSIGESAFYNCKNLKEVSIPGSVQEIADYAFHSCSNLEKAYIADGVQSIGNYAFEGCENLQNVYIPDSVHIISSTAFRYCKLTTAGPIGGGYDYEFGWTQEIPKNAFANCAKFTNVTLPSGIQHIGEGAFYYCQSIDYISIPDGVINIGNRAFYASNLSSIKIPNSVTSIGDDVFYGCNNLEDIYYAGSKEEWDAISGIENTDFINITIHYNSTGPDSGTTDDRTTSVKYLTGWDETSKMAVFSDDIYIRYTAVTDADLPSGGVAQLVNHYVLVECAQDESDVNKGQLFRLRSVNSVLGSLTAGTETAVTIDGVEYPWDSQTGSIIPGGEPLQVLYHTIDGALAGYTVLSEKMGTAGDWNGTDTVHLDGVDFHTNYMTDQDSLAEISKITDKDRAVVYYFAGDALLKAKLGDDEPVDPPIKLYTTKIGTLTAFDLDQMTLAIDEGSFAIQDKQSVKDALKDNLKDAIGKKTVFVITSGKISYAMPLERVSTRLEAIAIVEPSTIVYQGGYDRTSITAKVEVRNVYDVDPWVDTNMLATAIAQNIPDWNGDITLDHADFEITWRASEQSGASIEKCMVFSDGAYEDRPLVNDCKTTVKNTTTLSLNESTTISANIAVNPDYSHDNSKFADDFPKGETEKTVQVSAQVEGQDLGGEMRQNSSNCSIIARYPNNERTEEEIEEITAKASTELNKIDGAISLDLHTMSKVFGIEGEALDRLEKEILSVIVMSNIPEETLEKKISNNIVDKVLGKYIPNEVTASIYTVPLVYEIATPRYKQVTVQFNCEVHTYNLHGTNFALWVTVSYEILRSEIPVSVSEARGFLGQGTRTNVGDFSSAAYSLAEAELKKQYNEVWGNSANRVADFLFDDTVKKILDEMNTTFKDEVWKLIVWPTTNAKIDCPVNIYVYDLSGNLRGSIENDVVTKSSDEFGLSVEGETKYITGLEDLYAIKYVATDNGTMDITLTEFSGYETPARQIAFYNVPLIKEKSYKQSVPEAIKSETQEYQLLASDDTVVPADTDQSLLNLTPMPPLPSDPGTSGGDGSTTGGNSSGGGSSSAGYTIAVEDIDHGSIRVSPSRASRGDIVTITVDPDADYELGTLFIRDSSGNRIDVERQSDTRYTFEMPSSHVTVEATFVEISEEPIPEPTVLPFADVPASAWYYDAVRFVYERGMMAGTGNNQFSPNVTTTRAMIVTILYRLENQPAAGSSNFTDVPADQWYTNAVAWAAANGIVGGYGDGRFAPNDIITREQMAAILYRYAQYKGYDVGNTGDLSRYVDASQVSGWALVAIGWANAQGLIAGNTDTTLNPNGYATRAEGAIILMRFVENVPR